MELRAACTRSLARAASDSPLAPPPPAAVVDSRDSRARKSARGGLATPAGPRRAARRRRVRSSIWLRPGSGTACKIQGHRGVGSAPCRMK